MKLAIFLLATGMYVIFWMNKIFDIILLLDQLGLNSGKISLGKLIINNTTFVDLLFPVKGSNALTKSLSDNSIWLGVIL